MSWIQWKTRVTRSMAPKKQSRVTSGRASELPASDGDRDAAPSLRRRARQKRQTSSSQGTSLPQRQHGARGDTSASQADDAGSVGGKGSSPGAARTSHRGGKGSSLIS